MRTPNAIGLIALASTASAAATETHITPAEWVPVTANNEPWQCITKDIPSYLTKGPSPTPALSSALFSYESQFYASCSASRAPPVPFEPCPVPPRSALCSFSAAVPTTLMSAYSAYASAAASWWSAGNGDAVVSLVAECPYLWYDTLVMFPGSGANLNRTVAHAQCYAEVHPTSSGSGSSSSGMSGTGTGQSGATPTTTPITTPTSKPTVGGTAGRAGVVDSWAMAVSALGMAAAVNTGLF